jgi:hypothetical protein
LDRRGEGPPESPGREATREELSLAPSLLFLAKSEVKHQYDTRVSRVSFVVLC